MVSKTNRNVSKLEILEIWEIQEQSEMKINKGKD